MFNCPMVGTFNIRVQEKGIDGAKRARFDHFRNIRYYLVKLNHDHYGWAVRWACSRMPETVLEVISRRPLPESLKEGEIEVEVLERWDEKRIREWVEPLTFYQTFAEWLPMHKWRADSDLLWKKIKGLEWRGADVLDIGCNFGYFSFMAAEAGATVVGYDKNPNVIKTARTINDHIEMQDVRFTAEAEGGEFHIILYLSVHHQIDPAYGGLGEMIEALKKRARWIVFEDIVPPLKGELTEEGIDKILNSAMLLLRYRHKVRRMRKVWLIQGRR
jgi:SAM-dependent methyltransferase